MRPSVPTKQAPPSGRLFAWISFGAHHHAVAVTVADLAVLIVRLNRRGHVRINHPLDDVVVMRSPIDIAHKQAGHCLDGLSL